MIITGKIHLHMKHGTGVHLRCNKSKIFLRTRTHVLVAQRGLEGTHRARLATGHEIATNVAVVSAYLLDNTRQCGALFLKMMNVVHNVYTVYRTCEQ